MKKPITINPQKNHIRPEENTALRKFIEKWASNILPNVDFSKIDYDKYVKNLEDQITPLLDSGKPPNPPKTDTVHRVPHGYDGNDYIYEDPYHYMETITEPDPKNVNPVALAAFRREAEYGRVRLANTPGVANLEKKYKEISAQAKSDSGVTRIKTGEGSYIVVDSNIYLDKKEPEGTHKRTVLVNPSKQKDPKYPGKSLSVDGISVSRSGRFIAYGLIADGNTSTRTIHIFDTKLGKEIETDRIIERANWVDEVSWLPDESGFLYSKSTDDLNNKMTTFTGKQTFLRKFGQVSNEYKKDEVIMGDHIPGIQRQSISSFAINTFPDCPYVFALHRTGIRNDREVYVRRIDQPGAPWQKLVGFEDGVTDIAVHKNKLFLVAYNEKAPYGNIVQVDLSQSLDKLSKPGLLDRSKVVVANNATQVSGSYNPKHVVVVGPPMSGGASTIVAQEDGLYYTVATDGVENHIFRMNYSTGKSEEIPIPLSRTNEPIGTVVTFRPMSPGSRGLVFEVGSWIHPNRTYEYNPTKNEVTLVGPKPDKKFDNKNMVVKRVYVKSHDGYEVPATIMYDKTKVKPGIPAPTQSSVYAGCRYSYNWGFEIDNILWTQIESKDIQTDKRLKQIGQPIQTRRGATKPLSISQNPQSEESDSPEFNGGIRVFVHARGGGERGNESYLQGKGKTKPNSWKDYIAVAKYLIQEGYTTPGMLFGAGLSFGGIPIGRAKTDPEGRKLFGGFWADSAVMDGIRQLYEANGLPYVYEVGYAEDPEQLPYLYEMSPLHHVEDGVEYPPTIYTVGNDDLSVERWESGKMQAAVNAAHPNNRDIIRANKGGHIGEGGSPGSKRRTTVEAFAYLLSLMKPKKN